jgi:hypothetical protein
VTVPPDLEKALKRDAKARARFAALSSASKRRWLYRSNRQDRRHAGAPARERPQGAPRSIVGRGCHEYHSPFTRRHAHRDRSRGRRPGRRARGWCSLSPEDGSHGAARDCIGPTLHGVYVR